ncbi:MAG: hypothetical protein QW701_00255 [Candidatus Nezhaarchaeales archaeon]
MFSRTIVHNLRFSYCALLYRCYNKYVDCRVAKKVIATPTLFTLEVNISLGALDAVPKGCEVDCEFFRCAKKMIVRIAGNPRAKSITRMSLMCRETGEECLGSKCQYATCIRNAMLPSGTCGLEYRTEKKVVRSLEQEVKRYEEKYGSMLEKFKGKKLTEDMF